MLKNVNKYIFLFIYICITSGIHFVYAKIPSIENGFQALLDLNKAGGNLHTLPKTLINGNLYDNAYKNGERNLSKVVLDSLNATHIYMKKSCDGDIALSDIMQVFENTVPGKKLSAYLEHRESGPLYESNFPEACIQVVLCASGKTKTPLKDRAVYYSYENYENCQRIVETIYHGIALRGDAITAMENINYGDDMFANGKLDDAPFDLLHDVQKIGDIMYTHNDPATQIHFYDIRPLGSYQQSSPLIETNYTSKIPESSSQNPTKNFPASNGTFPSIPEQSYQDRLDTINARTPKDPALGPLGDKNHEFPEPIALGDQYIPSPTPVGNVGGNLGNNICEVPKKETETPRDLLQEATDQQEETVKYNKELDLDDRVALEIFDGLLTDEQAEKEPNTSAAQPRGSGGGTSALGGDSPTGTQGTSSNKGNTPSKSPDIERDEQSLSEMKKALQSCLEQSKLDKNTWRKQITKTRGEAVKLSACVQKTLCVGIQDPSNLGMYTIKFCKIPSKRYEVVANMPIHSIEEAVNELSNICSNLKSSNLTKHTQTKDGIFTTQIAKINFGKIFSFDISVDTKPIFGSKAPRDEKIAQEERNNYLKKTILDDTDNLTHSSQRNKYILVGDAARSLTVNEYISTPSVQQNRIQKTKTLQESQTPKEYINTATLSQQSIIGETSDQYEQFIHDQYAMREAIHTQLDDLNAKRKAKYNEFQNKTGK